MRHWLTPRCILVVLMLIAAPGAALAHLFVAWVPGRLAAVRLSRELVHNARQLDAEWEQSIRLGEEAARLQRAVAGDRGQSGPGWLPQRDRHLVFERVAEAFRDNCVSIERLTLDEPVLYAVVSRADLLTCEQITVLCRGDYMALAACLERVVDLDLPVRVVQLSWDRAETGLSLALRLQVPFVPDNTLREELADAEGLEENDEP